MKEMITKSTWLAAQQCPTSAWLDLRAEPEALGEAALFRMEQGREIGELARELFPNGILVSGTGTAAVDATQELIRIPETDTLFEAAFIAGKLTARADILKRAPGGWQVLEVKSSFSDTGSIKDYIDDLAYTVFVLRRSGLVVTSASLVLLSRAYQFGDGSGLLFEILDETAEVNARAALFESMADILVAALFANVRPTALLLSACRDCVYFKTDCLGTGVSHSVLEIPGLHHTKLRRLSAAGIIDMAHAPNDLGLNERQERARIVAVAGAMFVSPNLGTALNVFQFPCHYLDFETVATVLPLYDGHGCHRQVLTQFSVHRKDTIGSEPLHSEYLADATRECERDLAEALINALGTSGSIIVYSSFEKTRITALRDAFPDLVAPLQAILDRLADLLPILQDHVYHPQFGGSFSIKKVLPALIPTLSYAGLDVRDGDTAIARFARMAKGTMAPEEIAVTRQQLLDYCKLDTLAMVRLHENLYALGSANNLYRGGQPATATA
jgi:Domain of unknown function(DUF2779)